MPLAGFLLHPAGAGNDTSKNYLQPNINQIKQHVDRYNHLFRSIYRQCTPYSDDELNTILYSEDNSALIDASISLKRKISTGIAEKTGNTPVSYYILNDKQSE
ncbi:MAG: hypothetical protein RSD49_01125 [Hafnia sp.]